MSEELKLAPCPFCGGKASFERKGNYRQSTIVDCDECGCRLETGETWDAGAAWNRRDTTAVQREREECANVVDAYRERYGGNWPALVEVAAAIRRRGE